MSCANSPTLRQSGATSVFRPGAVAHTPFGTPFFQLLIDPNTDTGTFVKQRMGSSMREEIRAWKKLQRTGDSNSDTVGAPSAEPIVGGGFVVGGVGYPDYIVPDVDGPGEETGVGGASTAPTDGNENNENNEDRLWPDTYSIGSDEFDIDYILDGFVVIDMADATGSVFWNKPRWSRPKTVRGGGSPNLWSRFLSRVRPAGAMH